MSRSNPPPRRAYEPVVRRTYAPLALLIACALAAPPTPACSTFCFGSGDGLVFGKNYDWSFGDGMLFVNARGAQKSAQRTSHGEPARWRSRFGSVTFNQYGREFPSGGINEAGLVIELMWHENGRYAGPDARPTLGCLQWIQYQLDTAGTVDEVIASDARVRIDSPVPLHFLVADRRGHVAAVEFLDGRLIAHAGDRLPISVLTNDSYEESVTYVRKLEASGTKAPGGPASLARFARAAARLRGVEDEDRADAVAFAFDTLAAVAQPGSTQWSIVYEPAAGRVRFRTLARRQIRTVRLAALDFGCSSAGRSIDLASDVAGDITSSLAPYSVAANADLVHRSFAKTPFLAAAGEKAARIQSDYPQTITCPGFDVKTLKR
jgi:choloylglycine hydrolase